MKYELIYSHFIHYTLILHTLYLKNDYTNTGKIT
jgi:hypothetical protein